MHPPSESPYAPLSPKVWLSNNQLPALPTGRGAGGQSGTSDRRVARATFCATQTLPAATPVDGGPRGIVALLRPPLPCLQPGCTWTR